MWFFTFKHKCTGIISSEHLVWSLLSSFLKFELFKIHRSVLPSCMSVRYMLEEVLRLHIGAGNWTWDFYNDKMLLTTELITLQPWNLNVKDFHVKNEQIEYRIEIQIQSSVHTWLGLNYQFSFPLIASK